ncbi:MAG: Amuc_1099 family pilus-like system protein [Akkermansia sp.]
MADQSNSGRNILIVGALLGIAAAGYGGYTLYSAKTLAPDTQVNSGKGEGSLTAEAQRVKDNLKSDRTISDAAPEGALINGKPRMAPLFYSTELWQITLDDKQKNTVIDIYDPAAQNIHGDVPNTWFITSGIADALGRADGLEIDSDNDGFTNREEYLAHTQPADAASYPPLVQTGHEPKLEVKSVSVANALITFPTLLEDNPAEIEIRIFNSAADVSPTYKTRVAPGKNFDLKAGETTGRFTLLGFDKKSFLVGGSPTEETVLKVRDNVTASGAKEFTIRAGKPIPGSRDKGTANEKGYTISDTTVVFRVTGGTAAGKKGQDEIACQLGGNFVIPGGYSDGKPMNAKLESVDASGSVNILLEGVESPINIPAASKKASASKK